MKLMFKDSEIGDYPLEIGKSLTIGRRPTNNIVIDNPAISGAHAKIDALEDGYLLTDLKSKNGTFMNGQLVSSHWLMKGDVITIGKHTLAFTLKDGEEPPPEHDSMEETMVLDTSDYRAMLDKSSPSVSTQSAQKESVGVLSFLKGGEGEIELTKKLVKLGKDPSCDIVLSGFTVGKTAATISKRPTGYYLNYVEGLSKPKVNGNAVKDSIQLKEFDSIEIGSAKMEFIMKE
jgi:pSer/pThr/pTyr-binding forkhead associated (FHA) protein